MLVHLPSTAFLLISVRIVCIGDIPIPSTQLEFIDSICIYMKLAWVWIDFQAYVQQNSWFYVREQDVSFSMGQYFYFSLRYGIRSWFSTNVFVKNGNKRRCIRVKRFQWTWEGRQQLKSSEAIKTSSRSLAKHFPFVGPAIFLAFNSNIP